ncbi:hypothetical protein SGCZBJ_19365 [Caulobacter zeae]|uniref:GYF domain-containing protein n=1 Tax=Caulobacter zeae TaxID=2055137 RepID=A0A2N5D872_9CAUL|nr:GYF domain-containing protein [Caulobacter zeae]PLR22240.1 hypothetical protein SGCZBJ_19365 [Caulobacter zeae]
MTDWHVAEGDVVLGRFWEDDVRLGAARGDFPPWAKVWREGMAEWAPIGRLFPEARRRGRAHGLGLVLAWILGAAYLAALGLSITLLYSDVFSFGRLWTDLALWSGSGAATGLLAVVGPLVWVRVARGGEGGGALRILAVLAMVLGLGLSAMQLFQAPILWRLVQAETSKVLHGFDYEPKSRILHIDGEIGLGFARDLRAEFERHPDVARIDVSSPGGLVDEALRAARDLAGRKGMVVAARGQCASACVILLMGGEERLADYDMDIEFHASSLPPEFDTAHLRVGGRVLDREVRRFLQGRGVYAKGLDEAERLGPGKLYRVPAADLVAPGMLTGLVDEEDRRLSPAQARALVIENYGEPLASPGPSAND